MNQSPDKAQNDLSQLLQSTPTTSWFSGRRAWWLAGGAGVSVIAFLLAMSGGDGQHGQYVTEEAAFGSLVVTASASGTVQPTKSIDVGSEQSGTLAKVLAQENDVVKKGQLLAELDTSKFKDSVDKSRAALAAAEATVLQKQATVAEAKASLARMKQVAELSGGKVPAKTELETQEATLQRAIADEASAHSDVVQAKASLKTDETNLTKATTRSPIDGVVLTRKVEPGQTVAAQMTTPVLFQLAEDLTKMELQVKVDEADVANVKNGQKATFTVSAWPGRKFPATIQRVGYGSTTTDNVVTYKTILQVNNDDLALRPGMTATATIVTAERQNVLLVPNAALRFTPPSLGETPKKGFVASLIPGPPQEAKKNKHVTTKREEASVWVLEESGPQALTVKTGVSNGRQTEILGGDLKPGMAVITDYQEAKK